MLSIPRPLANVVSAARDRDGEIGVINTGGVYERLDAGGRVLKTFHVGPVGPGLVLLTPDEWKRWPDLHMRLAVNGQPRQDAYCRELIFAPAPSAASARRTCSNSARARRDTCPDTDTTSRPLRCAR